MISRLSSATVSMWMLLALSASAVLSDSTHGAQADGAQADGVQTDGAQADGVQTDRIVSENSAKAGLAEVNSGTPDPGAARGLKVGTTGEKLLLPLYLVNTADPNGTTTFFAIRNESEATVAVTATYYSAGTAYDPGSPSEGQFQQDLMLGTKAVETFDVRSFSADLMIDTDNFARGYIIFEADGGGAIHGDYFQVDNSGNFASGSRLLNIDPESTGNDLCTRFSMRFLDSALLFDSGTIFTIWFQPAMPYEGTAFSYSAFGLAGGFSLVDSSLPSAKFAFQIPASALLIGVNEEFGAIEFEFPVGTVGHVSGILSALGRFSVGFEATCLDPI